MAARKTRKKATVKAGTRYWKAKYVHTRFPSHSETMYFEGTEKALLKHFASGLQRYQSLNGGSWLLLIKDVDTGDAILWNGDNYPRKWNEIQFHNDDSVIGNFVRSVNL